MTAAPLDARTVRCARTGLALLVTAVGAGIVGGCADATPRRHEVVIRNFVYQPAALTLAVGDTVVWINEDVVPHTATASDGEWDSGSIASNASGQVVISGEGEQSYLCTFHPNMRAELAAQ